MDVHNLTQKKTLCFQSSYIIKSCICELCLVTCARQVCPNTPIVYYLLVFVYRCFLGSNPGRIIEFEFFHMLECVALVRSIAGERHLLLSLIPECDPWNPHGGGK